MASRIDDKTMIPLNMVASMLAVGLGVTATGTFWVAKVNDRLARIESKLGISVLETGIVPVAEAGEKEKCGPPAR